MKKYFLYDEVRGLIYIGRKGIWCEMDFIIFFPLLFYNGVMGFVTIEIRLSGSFRFYYFYHVFRFFSSFFWGLKKKKWRRQKIPPAEVAVFVGGFGVVSGNALIQRICGAAFLLFSLLRMLA